MIGGEKGQKWIAVVRGPLDDEPTTLPKGVRRRWKRGIPLFFFLLPLPRLPLLFLISFLAFCSPLLKRGCRAFFSSNRGLLFEMSYEGVSTVASHDFTWVIRTVPAMTR